MQIGNGGHHVRVRVSVVEWGVAIWERGRGRESAIRGAKLAIHVNLEALLKRRFAD